METCILGYGELDMNPDDILYELLHADCEQQIEEFFDCFDPCD